MNGVGNLTQHTPAFGTVPHFENVIGHALVGCLMASAGGGGCKSGALAGAVPAFAGPLINGETFSVRALVLNTTLGGLAAVAGGGKFANGAVTGAFGYLFNAAINQLEQGNDAHRTLEAYARQTPGILTEVYSDTLGTPFGGRVDIANPGTGEIWDIKPNNAIGIFEGRVEAEYYSIFANTFGPNEYQPGGVPSFMPPTITLPGQYGTYTYTFVGDGVITYDPKLYPQNWLVPMRVPRILPIPSPAPILRVLPVLP
jgi:hypothetical protein